MSFLEGRNFSVKVEGNLSSIKIICCGVPQGGVLSPTLFSIYINDVPTAEGEKEITLLFADDIAYQLKYKFRKNKKLIPGAEDEATRKAQNYLDRLENWTNLWHLSLAPQKCAQLTFSKAQSPKLRK